MKKIHIQNLTMKVKDKCILDSVSLDIKQGESVAILGPNGAGKTTLVNAILGLQKFKNGEIINDFKSLPAYKIGVHMQESNLNGLMKVKEVLDLFLFDGSYTNLIDKYNLKDKLNQRISTLSGGEKQKLQLILAFQNNPEIIFIDEITTGLDMQSRKNILEFIKNETSKKGKTLIMVTHYFEEVEELSNKIAFLNNGKLIEYGDKIYLFNKYNIRKMAYIETIDDPSSLTSEFPNSKVKENIIEITIEDKEKLVKIMNFISHNDEKIRKYSFVEPSIEKLYSKLIGGNA